MEYKKDTICVQGGYRPASGESRIPPIVQSTTFFYDSTQGMADLFDLKADGYFYTRLANPTVAAFEGKVAALEGGGFSLFFVCIPNTPDGALLPRAALFSLLEACVKQGTRMVADACFFDFVRDAGYTLSELCAAGATVVQSLTKSYALAGVRVGYLLASDASALAPYLQPWNLSCFALAAGEACARDRAYLKKMRELVERERAYLFGGLCALGYRPRESYANFLLFSCAESVPAALRARGFAVRVCADFEGLCPEKGKTYVRICVKRRAENKKFLRALAEVTE